MLPSEKDQIRHYWDNRALDYSKETGHGFSSAEEYGLWSEVVRRNLPPSNGRKALDLGTGPGYMAMLLCQLGYETKGLDVSENMLSLARQKAQKAGLAVEFLQGDVDVPPFEENSMDIIVCRHIMWTLPDVSQAIATWKSILKDRGSLLVIDGIWSSRTIEGLMRTLAGNLIRTVKDKKLPTNWKKKYVSDQRILPYIDGAPAAVVINALEALGFRNIRHDPLKEIIAFERRNGSLDYRIQFAHYPRYLISAEKADHTPHNI